MVNPWVVTFSVMLATFMEVLDSTVVNVSIPHIAGNLASTNEEGTWVVTSYPVSNAVVPPISGWLANYMGRKRLLLTCVAGFTLTSLLCGFATSLPQLIILRILQELTGGGLQPLAQAILLETFPRERHGHAMAAFGIGILLAPILGPTLGGWITDNYSWRWIFGGSVFWLSGSDRCSPSRYRPAERLVFLKLHSHLHRALCDWSGRSGHPRL